MNNAQTVTPIPLAHRLTTSAARLRPGARYSMKTNARITRVNDQSAVARAKPMERPRSPILGTHFFGGAYSVCATPMAVYISPKELQAKMTSGPVLVAIITIAGEEQ